MASRIYMKGETSKNCNGVGVWQGKPAAAITESHTTCRVRAYARLDQQVKNVSES
jgi:hypothetical protein